MNSYERERENPLAYRKTSRLKRAWKMWMFDRKGKKVQRQRDREIQALIKKK